MGMGEGCCTQPYPCICKEAVSGFEPMTNKSPRHNFTAAPGLALSMQTHIKFGVILWHIWKRRNSNVFEDALLLVHKVLLLINSMVHDIFFSKSRFIYHRCKAYSWINVGWKPPDIVLMAELWGIFSAIQLAWEKAWVISLSLYPSLAGCIAQKASIKATSLRGWVPCFQMKNQRIQVLENNFTTKKMWMLALSLSSNPKVLGCIVGTSLTTSIVAPPLLSLPYAFTFLSLVIGAFVTFYSYNLISRVLEHHAQMGKRQLRFRDMARDILGQGWGHYFVGPIQFAVCYGAVVACTLLGGLCMKAIYLLSNPNGTMKLYEFVIIFGCFMLILAQIPSFHSLRHINLVSLVLCLAYSAGATIGSIYIVIKRTRKGYSLKGDSVNRLFGIFNVIAIIATTYGNGIIPAIQGRCSKDCVCYLVLIVTFFSVSVSGYWAFGNESEGLILSNFVDNGKPLVPKWFIYMTNILIITQLSAVGVVYLQPTNEVLEQTFGDPKSPEFSKPNVIPRVISRSLATTISTTIAAMLPFFGDINSLIGAFGFIPLDFILPMVFYNLTFKPSKRSPIFWLNVTIVVAFSALGAIAAVRQIVLDAKNYQLFANI
ncbi:GABA transporter 1 [Glycine soja]